jgi:predicted nucleic acid-binding protein
MLLALCLDTYALVEMHGGNPDIEHIYEEEYCVPELLVVEFYDIMYRRYGLKTAEYWKRRLSNVTVTTPRELLFLAMRFKRDHNKEDLSFFDCVGYMYARQHKMQFVTGDKAFKGKPGVKFIGR